MRIFFFVIKDGIGGIFRSKFTTFLTIASLSLALMMLIFYYLISRNILLKVSELKSRVTIEVFLEPGADTAGIEVIGEKLRKIAGVDSVKFISKEAALKKFEALFSGEYVKLIDENPLPESFQVKLGLAGNRDQIQNTISEIQIVDGVDEVVYRQKLLGKLNQYFDSLRRIFIAVGAGLLLVSFILLWINIKLTLKTKERVMDTMRLVGARKGIIIGPYYVQAVLEGIIASMIAVSGAYLIYFFARMGELLPLGLDLAVFKWVVIIATFFSVFTCFLATHRQE